MADPRVVSAGFDVFIRARFQRDPALMLFVLTHERRHIAETNCLREWQLCEKIPRMKFNKKKLELLIAAAASIFCDLAKAAKEKQLMTQAELKRQEQKAGELADTQDMLDQMAKEAMSTAISKPVQGFRDGGQEASGQHGDQLGGDRGHGPEVRPSGDNPPVPGADTEAVQTGDPLAL